MRHLHFLHSNTRLSHLEFPLIIVFSLDYTLRVGIRRCFLGQCWRWSFQGQEGWSPRRVQALAIQFLLPLPPTIFTPGLHAYRNTLRPHEYSAMDQEAWDQSRRWSPVEELGLDQVDYRKERGW